MDRLPIIITLGGALLGWIAGHMLVTDVVIAPLLSDAPHWIHYLAGGFGALFVVALGTLLARRRLAETVPLAEVASGHGGSQTAKLTPSRQEAKSDA
jgi:predicted tellurium resistance membrane protein TerC